ncbi:glycosyltransferase [Desulfovibrio desulfuricans]|uniref:glycosyltransferase n=1 Tax=Desulfovibrio desulfuricans TaxID=876 RepID=UPI001FD7587A|nr:glycosyltransferase [Desulfovibrio desulfuricans]
MSTKLFSKVTPQLPLDVEIYPKAKSDRRLAPNIPGRGGSRRGAHQRYEAQLLVSVYDASEESAPVRCLSEDLSSSGMLLHWAEDAPLPAEGQKLVLRFTMPPGILPEGYESRVRIPAEVVRIVIGEDGEEKVAVNFVRNLDNYLRLKKWLRLIATSVILLALSVYAVAYMRQESLFYFMFDVPVFTYGIIASVFLVSRFVFSFFYRNVPVDPDFTPGVTIVIPCFNEEEWIEKTIQCAINQDYPQEKLEVILVDDGSTDKSMERVRRIEKQIRKEITGDRFVVIEQPYNMGKRHALAAGALHAKFELLVFVDSDSFLEPDAVREVVQPFRDPKMGAVSGRTEVQNKWTNALTKMQAVRYYVAFRFIKAAESVFDGVTCLSGPLACYRKDLVLHYLDEWLNQKFFGYPATFGDDRSLTNYILAHHRTGYQDAAVCSTIVPSRMRTFIRQQMRWKRSWLRETLRASSFMWRKEPFMALSFYIGFLLPVLAPLVVVRTMVVIPLELGLFPYKYLAGILVTSMLMSASYLLFKRSNLWPYGIVFCVFYLGVLLWQLPVAVLTFWKSEWGTRNTSADVAAQEKLRYEQKMFVMPSESAVAAGAGQSGDHGKHGEG